MALARICLSAECRKGVLRCEAACAAAAAADR
jgi:hypothetical protein